MRKILLLSVRPKAEPFSCGVNDLKEGFRAREDSFKEKTREVQNNFWLKKSFQPEITIATILFSQLLQREYARAERYAAEARKIMQSITQRKIISVVLYRCGLVALEQGDLERAEHYFLEMRAHGLRNEISSSKEKRNDSPVTAYCPKAEESPSGCCTSMRKGQQARSCRGGKRHLRRAVKRRRVDQSQKSEQRELASHGA